MIGAMGAAVEVRVPPVEGESAGALARYARAGHVGPMDDRQAVAGWLAFVEQRNAQTYRSYRFEVTRFRMFLETLYAHDEGRSRDHLLRDATETDISLYEAILRGSFKNGNPAPLMRVPHEVMIRHGRASQPFLTTSDLPCGVVNDRPVSLKASSVNQAMNILHALYEHWLRPDPQTKSAYVGANPVRRVKASSTRAKKQIARSFPMEAVNALMESLELNREAAMAAGGQRARAETLKIARQRWMVALLFGLWGRRAELARLVMGDFRHNGVRWTVSLTRKGDKEQDLPVAPWVMQELSVYRQSIGLSPLPFEGEEEPAIARLKRRAGSDRTVHPDTLYREITEAAGQAAWNLRDRVIMVDLDDVERELLAKKLEQISPHWFRHSGASIAINAGVMSLDNASKMLGHSSPTITAGMYYHPDDALIEDGMQKLGAGLRTSRS